MTNIDFFFCLKVFVLIFASIINLCLIPSLKKEGCIVVPLLLIVSGLAALANYAFGTFVPAGFIQTGTNWLVVIGTFIVPLIVPILSLGSTTRGSSLGPIR